jgi:hypothetical protein
VQLRNLHERRAALALAEERNRYREEAERCRMLARTTLDKEARLILLDLEADFNRAADELEIDPAKREGA